MSKKLKFGTKMAANFSTVLGTLEEQYLQHLRFLFYPGLTEQNTVVLFSNLTTSQKNLWDGQKSIRRCWPFKGQGFFVLLLFSLYSYKNSFCVANVSGYFVLFVAILQQKAPSPGLESRQSFENIYMVLDTKYTGHTKKSRIKS